ncbi:hypothetical protein Clacol_002381 [Clathrus columnatus]|uniref:U4/U6.U5 tri-snRNP-associated protein 1 n=1 Tax=Clathrus columnatus TaxID=1419009 RepID=A0AAV5A693_9AGAM|nr:hypothetical protein Clacol_002381 [Clathrus columnatus]
MAESISLEETNKIRISLGLKPLTDDSAPTDTKELTAEDNYAKQREEGAKQRERKRIQDTLAKIKNRRELNSSLKGTTLADGDDVDDTLKWIKRSKKKAKELAKKRQEELDAMDKALQEDYSEKDLAGLKVRHDLDALDEGEEQILTLKDSRILDNEEDELQNVELAEHERTKKNLELKTKKRDYTGYDDEEFKPGNEGMKRAVLAKYDDELNGALETGFRLGSGSVKSSRPTRQMQEEAAAQVNKTLLSIDYAKNMEMSDYLKAGDTKKKRPTRRAGDNDLNDIPTMTNGMEIDTDTKPRPRVNDPDENFVDDEDLQAVLAKQRREKLRKTRLIAPDDVALRSEYFSKICNQGLWFLTIGTVIQERQNAQAEAAVTMDVEVKEEDAADGEGGLEFDDTSEFVKAIQYNPVKQEEQPVKVKREESVQPSIKQRTDSPMETDEAVYELEAGEVTVKEEDDDIEDEEMLNAIEANIKSIEAQEQASGVEVDVGTSSEQTFSAGLASTLTILRQQGILAPATSDQIERDKIQRQRDLWLAEQRKRLAQRELDRVKARGSGKDQATREYENRAREQQDARESLDLFKNYKPDINIVYYDEFGRQLTPKEAWKALSHKFHGKTSGKAKTEKRLKKIAEEKKKEAMASGDTPLSMNKAFQIRQEKAGQAHMVLSVGNRGAVPQLSEFLDTQPLSKNTKGDKKGKKKKEEKAASPQVIDITSFTAMPGVPSLPGSMSPPPIPTADSPVPRPGFSRIMNETASPAPLSSSSTPVPVNGERTKVAFGFGVKRKAVEEATGTPAKKR